ncbi:uncharacterized protein [Chelonus insularis]|uniref:uncharacterized protein n=1 Tax=Chelonus insularis TaxID=460826 RepID=UPI00158BB2EE|nr:uncharacterized protein LOC118069429 [Chelonus insularis]
MIKLLGIIAVIAVCCSAAPSSDVKSCIGTCPKTDTPNQIVLLASTMCAKYCKCEAGSPIVYGCRNDWYFSIDEGTCVPPKESHCPASASR